MSVAELSLRTQEMTESWQVRVEDPGWHVGLRPPPYAPLPYSPLAEALFDTQMVLLMNML